MKFINLVTLCIFFLWASSCYNEASNFDIAQHEMNKFGRKIRYSDDCFLVGAGGCFQDEQIKVFDLTIHSKKLLKIDQARELYLKLMSDFAKQVNNNQKVISYLPDHCFLLKNIDVFLGLFDENYDDPNPPHIANVFKTKSNTIAYNVYDYNSDKYMILEKETFDEALNKLKRSNEELYYDFVESFNFKIDRECISKHKNS